MSTDSAAPSTPLFIVNVEAAVVQDGRYLMVIRSEREAHAGGTLSFPGGKVEYEGPLDDVLEATARREVLEETGITVAAKMAYVESKSFVVDEPVVDIVLLCRYQEGDIVPGHPDEVAGVEWLTAEEILAHPKTPPWTAQSIRRAEQVRHRLGW